MPFTLRPKSMQHSTSSPKSHRIQGTHSQWPASEISHPECFFVNYFFWNFSPFFSSIFWTFMHFFSPEGSLTSFSCAFTTAIHPHPNFCSAPRYLGSAPQLDIPTVHDELLARCPTLPHPVALPPAWVNLSHKQGSRAPVVESEMWDGICFGLFVPFEYCRLIKTDSRIPDLGI